jgi:hypothetical protein
MGVRHSNPLRQKIAWVKDMFAGQVHVSARAAPEAANHETSN